MIAALGALAGANNRRKLNRLTVALLAEGILAGLALVLLVPVLRAVVADDLPGAWRWLAAMALVWALFVAVRLGAQIYGFRLAIEIGRALFECLGAHIGRLPMGWFDADRVGEVSRMASQGIINVMGIPAHLLRHLIVGLVTPLTLLCALFWFDWRLALAATLVVPLVWLLISRAAGRFQEQEHAVHLAAVRATERIVEFAQIQKTLRLFGYHQQGRDALDRSLRDQHRAAEAMVGQARRGIAQIILGIEASVVVVLVLAVNFALGGRIDAAELVTILFLIIRYVEPVLTAAQIEGALRAGQNGLDRLQALQQTAPQPEGRDCVPQDKSLTLEHVHFGYDAAPVLRDVTLEIPQGSMVALVGPSGAGKTTLLRLISREWDVDQGCIRIGGRDIRDVPLAALMQQMSIVFQRTYLFSGTIAENIKLGQPQANAAEIARVAALARVQDLAERLPKGLDSPVGEGGSRLSGGERQRIAMARALLKHAPILLLDEATAALDPINETALQHSLAARAAHQTLIVVAHRLQTIRAADQIVFLEAGEIREQGRHEDLLALGGRYASFWLQRQRAEGWRLVSEQEQTHD